MKIYVSESTGPSCSHDPGEHCSSLEHFVLRAEHEVVKREGISLAAHLKAIEEAGCVLFDFDVDAGFDVGYAAARGKILLAYRRPLSRYNRIEGRAELLQLLEDAAYVVITEEALLAALKVLNRGFEEEE